MTAGPAPGQARKFVAHLTTPTAPGAEPQEYDLRVNHPLTIGGTDVFLIGHGYAPVITIRDGNGDVAYSGPTVFLPEDQSFQSFGVVKAPDARARSRSGSRAGSSRRTPSTEDDRPFSVFGDALNPVISMQAYVGDLGMDTGAPQSVYLLDKTRHPAAENPDGSDVPRRPRARRHRRPAGRRSAA